ncbi:YggT family protein [Sphingomonas morindae]|uniref:YggT family protein n=1 Tax=Sphingomonas morindae TaxID=1541170 RepID=A0ABY4XB58_9SPHN|nr:YggT family protein [Sphingomonas morindae]USI74200.1 YggT family protein [Sphingomonas morindae]
MFAIYQILQLLLTILFWIIMIQVVISWLFAFNVINHHNEMVRSIVRGLDAVTEPIYRPIRRILPDFGGLDFAPMVVLLLIYILQRILLPSIFASLIVPGAM